MGAPHGEGVWAYVWTSTSDLCGCAHRLRAAPLTERLPALLRLRLRRPVPPCSLSHARDAQVRACLTRRRVETPPPPLRDAEAPEGGAAWG